MTPTDAAPPGGPAAGGAASARHDPSDAALARVVREEAGRIVAALTATLGDLDLAEESVAAAVEAALREWRRRGIPARPAAWLTQAAKHDAIDRLRREKRYRAKLEIILGNTLFGTSDASTDTDADAEVDDRLPLLFGCCHPALASEAQLALTLRAVCGLTTAQIARATLTPEATVAQRIVRAKRKISAAGVPIRIPEAGERADRLDIVLTVIAVMYSEAHLLPGRDAAADRDLADDALWLAGVVAAALPSEPEAHGLVALLRFHRAREGARAVEGELVLLAEQDRSLWDVQLIAEGHRSLNRAAMLRRPGRWQLQAAIAACHADAPASDRTDWLQVLTLYDMLLRYDDSPVVRLNRAVALAAVEGPSSALIEVDALEAKLSGYHLWHAVRAHLLRLVGRGAEATAEDLRALELTANQAERRLLAARVAL